jgi:hypothetical protein
MRERTNAKRAERMFFTMPRLEHYACHSRRGLFPARNANDAGWTATLVSAVCQVAQQR